MSGMFSLAKMVVNKKFPDEQDEYIKSFFIAALYGLLCKYKEYANIVCDVFLRVEIYMDSKPISDILKEHEFLVTDNEEDEDDYTTFGASDMGHYFYVDDKDNIKHDRTDPAIICTLVNVDITHLLNIFCHEMSHLIKGEINNYSYFKEKKTINHVLRTGYHFSLCKYNPKYDELTSFELFETFDELINTLQSTEILEYIISLKEYVNDENIIDFINSLDQVKIHHDYGYNNIIPYMKEFWKNDKFKKAIEQNIISGDIETVIRHIDKTIGYENAFYELIETFDDLAYTEDSKQHHEYVKRYQEILNNYKRNS